MASSTARGPFARHLRLTSGGFCLVPPRRVEACVHARHLAALGRALLHFDILSVSQVLASVDLADAGVKADEERRRRLDDRMLQLNL